MHTHTQSHTPPFLPGAGLEWRDDAALLSSVVPRAALAASVTGRAPSIMVAIRGSGSGASKAPLELQPEWPAVWGCTPMGLLASEVRAPAK